MPDLTCSARMRCGQAEPTATGSLAIDYGSQQQHAEHSPLPSAAGAAWSSSRERGERGESDCDCLTQTETVTDSTDEAPLLN